MPRENRKRGKRKPKNAEETPAVEIQEEYVEEPQTQSQVGPSWIVAKPQDEELNPEAPFGYVDSDVKAYFRTVDTQIRSWQDGEEDATGNEDGSDPNAEKQMFFVAALNEMTGKEKQLATDPDCSIVLERMAYSMDDFVRRVFLDTLSGSYEVLVKHRFASHVCQTLFSVSAETVSREANGIFPSIPESGDGELRTMSQLILDICEELLPSLNTLMMDPFASHVIRVLLSLLCPAAFSKTNFQLNMRSKKSSSWKSKQGNLGSLFTDNKGKGKEGSNTHHKTPPEFGEMSRRFVKTLRKDLGGNEVRALAANDVASPCLTMLLHVESELGMADEPDSLMDRVTVGAVSAAMKGEDVQASDYLGTLFRDPTSSHLLEAIMVRASEKPFSLLWSTYLKGKLPRLAIHPVANYVVAKSLERVNPSQLETAYEELEASWEKLVSSARTSVLRAVIDRSATLQSSEQDAIEAVFKAFHLSSPEEKKLLVPCVLSLKSIEDYRVNGPRADNQVKHKKSAKSESTESSFEASIQGSLLLQSALKLSESYSLPIVDSLTTLDIQERLKIAYDSAGSRIMDAILDSSTLSPKVKRQFVMSFMGHFHELVDDRIGSRVGDRCFAFADTYLKEKIARSVVPFEQNLIGSFYGKFFSRNLNLYLLRRRPDEWRSMQSNKKQEQVTPPAPSKVQDSPKPDSSKPKKRKREGGPKDEIDEVFASAPIKKLKGPGLAPKAKEGSKDEGSGVPTSAPDLQEVFNAIRSAPKNEAKQKGHKGHKNKNR